jgi:hypothetical protein
VCSSTGTVTVNKLLRNQSDGQRKSSAALTDTVPHACKIAMSCTAAALDAALRKTQDLVKNILREQGDIMSTAATLPQRRTLTAQPGKGAPKR